MFKFIFPTLLLSVGGFLSFDVVLAVISQSFIQLLFSVMFARFIHNITYLLQLNAEAEDDD